MSSQQAFFDWLDEQPQCPEGLLVQTPRGETRCVPFPSPAEFRSRRKPHLERARNLTAIYGHMIEREEREQ